MGDDKQVQAVIDELMEMQERLREIGRKMRDWQLPGVDNALGKAHDAIHQAITGFEWRQG